MTISLGNIPSNLLFDHEARPAGKLLWRAPALGGATFLLDWTGFKKTRPTTTGKPTLGL